jgi:hypothetical protein
MIFSMLLEGLQALAPDRTPNLMAAIDGAGGVLAAALLVELNHPRTEAAGRLINILIGSSAK